MAKCNAISLLKYYTSSTTNALKARDILEQARIFSMMDIAGYSKLTHDSNPSHFDSGCAQDAGFTDILVPGILVASLFPSIIASHFPGAVYVKQTLEFKLPVFIGDNITGKVQASNIRQMKEKFMVKFVTKCLKDDDVVVIGGEATAILPTLVVKQVNR